MSEGLADMNMPHRLIRASAGSGKTYQLSNRYLSLLRDGADADRILATTFTRKAAGEILARVMSRLVEDQGSLSRELADAFPPPDGQRQRNSRDMTDALVHKLDRLSISTLDSFFHRLASSFAMELSMPAGAALMDDGDPLVQELRLDAIEAVLSEAGEADGSFAALLALLQRLNHDQAKRSTTDAILDIVSTLHSLYIEQPDAEAWAQPPLTTAGGLLDDAALQRHLADLDRLEADTPTSKNSDKPDGRFSKVLNTLVQLIHRQDWQALATHGFCEKITSDDPSYYGKPIPASWIATLSPLIDHARLVVLKQIQAGNIARHSLLERYHRHFAAMKRSRNVLTFSDVTTMLCRALPDREEIYYRLDGRIEHLLLDEFQDTSPAQWQVLRPLAEETAATFDRSFFCVGDVKQAIYGWRGGCAQLFNQVIADLHLPPEAIQDLSVNWRSSQTVLDAVNRVFGSMSSLPVMSSPSIFADTAATWTAGYEGHRAAHKNAELPGHVCLLTSELEPEEDAGDGRDDADDTDASDQNVAVSAKAHDYFVARHIAQLATQHPNRSIGVLVRRRKTAALLIDLLRLQNVEASGEGGSAVTDDYMVNLILVAMDLADHPADSIAAFQLAHSPMAEVLGLDEQSPAAVARTIRKQVMDEGYASVVAGWARAVRPLGDERNRRRLGQLIQLGESYEERVTGEASVRPSRMSQFVRSKRVEEASSDAIRVMTVHQSKGLEFDIVVLPELTAPLIGAVQQQSVCVLRDSETSPIRAVCPNPATNLRALNETLMLAHEQEQGRRLNDDLAVLYVAMTRARQALWMIVPPLSKTKSGWSSTGYTNNSYATLLRQALAGTHQDDFDDATLGLENHVLYQHGPRDWDTPRESAQPQDASTPAAMHALPRQLRLKAAGRGRGRDVISPSGMESQGVLHGRDLLWHGGGPSRLRGSVIHAWFEQVGWLDEGEVPSVDDLHSIAMQLGATEEQVAEWAQTFEHALQQPQIQALLSRSGSEAGQLDQLHNELALAWVEKSGRMVYGRADRVVVAGGGAGATVIDFKTDDLGEPVDASRLASAVERYRPQLAMYIEAVAKRFDLPADSVSAKLVMVLYGRVVDIDGDAT